MLLTTEYWAYARASDVQPINQYIVANERHMPEFTTGGKSEADIAVPTIAFTPPIVMATTTAIPEAKATSNPYARLTTKNKMLHARQQEHREQSFLSVPSPRSTISLLRYSGKYNPDEIKPIVRPVKR